MLLKFQVTKKCIYKMGTDGSGSEKRWPTQYLGRLPPVLISQPSRSTRKSHAPFRTLQPALGTKLKRKIKHTTTSKLRLAPQTCQKARETEEGTSLVNRWSTHAGLVGSNDITIQTVQGPNPHRCPRILGKGTRKNTKAREKSMNESWQGVRDSH